MTAERPKILIIDDDPNLRKTLSDILRAKGYEPVTAGTGAEGLVLIKKEHINLALIDLGLPDIPGMEVLHRIKEDHPSTEAIILTGNATLDSAIEATNKGAFSYLQKPYEIDQLMLHMRRALEKQRTEGMIVRQNNELRERNAELRRSNQELQNFVYIASHDLQEPLRKVTVFGERLHDKLAGALDEQCVDYLNRMIDAAHRMQTLIDGLLEYSRVTTKAQPFVTVDLNAVVQEALSDLEVRIEQVKGRVEAGELPAIEADPLQMRQLFQNLICNALKFHKPDEPPVVMIHSRILNDRDRHSAATSADGLCQITVKDNGIGFDEKYIDRIFGVFQRLHGRNEYEGTGIGLAICKKIVERHGGSITATSRPDQGATFVVTLPGAQSRKEVKNVVDS